MRNTVLKFWIIVIMTGGVYTPCHGQTSSDSLNVEKQQYHFVESFAEFPGGEKELFCFIHRNLNKQLLQAIDTTGEARVQFTIDITGQVSDIKVFKSLTEIVDSELLRIIGLMPNWKPALTKNIPYAVSLNIPLQIPYDANYGNKFCH